MWVPDEEERKEQRDYLKDEGQKSPKLEKRRYVQIQETQSSTKRINPKRPTLRYIKIKLLKDKERILKVVGKKWLVTNKVSILIKIINEFLSRNLGGQKALDAI